MAITLFNWNELLIQSKRDLAAIVCLTYGQTKEYNEISAKTMRKTLNLHHIPLELFSRKLFTSYKHTLICNYKTKDPQSYFTNSSFLFTAASASYKVEYLKLLSMRRITDKHNWIPLEYYDVKRYNPFFNVKHNKIIFYLESSL